PCPLAARSWSASGAGAAGTARPADSRVGVDHGGGVYGQPAVPGPAPILNDLGRDVHRGALTHNRLLSTEKNEVCFRDPDPQDQRWQTMIWPAHEVIRRLLQPVWPQGVHNVRYAGLGSPLPRPLRHPLQRCLAGDTADSPPTAPDAAPHATDSWCPPCRAG